MIRVKPSRFNARSIAPDGTLLLYNSYSGAFSGVPARARSTAESLLSKRGSYVEHSGMAKYLLDRGFLVPYSANEMNRMRMLYGQQQYRSDTLELILLSSEQCNFRCVYCYETFPRDTMEPWVRQALLVLIKRRIPQVRSLHIAWFGGEPLMGLEAIREIAPQIKTMAEENGVHYASNMTTNGYLLTEDVFRELLSYNIRSYQISVDGNAASHDCKRVLKEGGSTYDVIYENLLAAKKVMDSFTITIRINFDHDNMSGLNEFMQLLKRDFANDSRFELRFFPVGQWGGDKDSSLSVCGTTGYDEKMRLEVESAAMGLNPEDRLPMMQARTGLGVCYAARPYNFLIGADGKIMKCTIALDQKDYNIVGQLRPNGNADIDIEKLAKWVSPDFEDDPGCRKCFFSPVCQGCSCPLVRLNSGERPCPDEKRQIGPTLQTLWTIKKHKAYQYEMSSGKVSSVPNTSETSLSSETDIANEVQASL